ncbi:hypothetical protein [uncultured Shewanella sp.]|uniref:hypothetical protein n=1 Tax=uncultured Shewanella sp. TaxID=173975 RepID=UPI0026203387|nr:hypothetical protein [uncultured Shewanella sp.]
MKLLYVKTFAYISILSILSACNESENQGYVQTQLSLQESAIMPGKLEFHASDSTTHDGSELTSITFTVTDLTSNEIVYGPVTLTENLDDHLIDIFPHNSDAQFTSLTSDYLVSATAKNSSGDQHTDKAMISLNAALMLISHHNKNENDDDFDQDGDDDGVAVCGYTEDLTSTDTEYGRVTCTMDSSVSSFSGSDMFDSIKTYMENEGFTDISYDSSSTPVWLFMWGAAGSSGVSGQSYHSTLSSGGKVGYDLTSNDSGGEGGEGGFAQMIVTAEDMESTLYYYLGTTSGNDNAYAGVGGSSSLLVSADPTSDASDDEISYYLIAGGGGGGGSGYYSSDGSTSYNGGAGGSGGIAISDTQDASSEDGNQGSSIDDGSTTDAGGYGGSSGTGGTGAYSGGDGFGGYAKSQCIDDAYWINDDSAVFDDGYGAQENDDCSGGGGGGGYGGGGSGSDYSGGGGGASYAAASTQNNDEATTSDTASTNSNSTGSFYMVINPEG